MLSSLILLIVIAAGCTQQNSIMTNASPTHNTSEDNTSSQYVPDQTDNVTKEVELNLTISVPKTTVTTGESFTGQYIAENKGTPFNAYIVTICRKEGFEKECVSEAVKDPFPDEEHAWNRDFKQVLKPCEISDNSMSCTQDNFKYPGTYNYELEVYDCSQIEDILGVDCSIDIDYSNVKSQVPILDSITQIVTVTQNVCVPQTCQQLGYVCGVWSDGCGGALSCGSCSSNQACSNGQCLIQGCRSNTDCNQACAECDTGKYVCNLGNYTCVQCVTNFNCIDGYGCENNICVKYKTCAEYGGTLCSQSQACIGGGTMKTASDGKCCVGGQCA